MEDFDIETDALSIPARETLAVLDRYIDFIRASELLRGNEVRMSELKLYTDRWDELDKSIRHVSGQDFGLMYFTHRGVKIVPWEGN